MLSEIDVDRIAKAVAEKMEGHSVKCITFTEAEIAEMKGVANTMKNAKKVALSTIVGFVVLGAIALLFGGLFAKAGEWFGTFHNAASAVKTIK